jgi:3-deoxy-manno-octulosonate cytidylyltransferase (CMP-KDO synthetase)
MRVVAIIPARYASTRFPGKPLVDIGGKSMIQRVVEQVQSCSAIAEVMVATDDDRILQHVGSLGVRCVMTSPHHPSGTDRCLEAYQLSGLQADCILNVQGDEPFVDAQQLNALAQLIARPDVSIATLVKTITDAETLFDASKVKVVMNAHSQALYFSRQAIPFNRNSEQAVWLSQHTYYKHLGLYAYKPEVLKWHKEHNSGFKFVINVSEDIDEIWRKYVTDENGINIPLNRIWFMPCCGSRQEHIEKAPVVAEYAKAMHVNFSPRLQLLIYNKALKV